MVFFILASFYSANTFVCGLFFLSCLHRCVVVSSLAITSGPHTSLLCLINSHFSASVSTQSHHPVSLHAHANIHASAVSLASELFCPITLLMPSCSFACVWILVGIEWLWLTGWPRFFIFYRPFWAVLQDPPACYLDTVDPSTPSLESGESRPPWV